MYRNNALQAGMREAMRQMRAGGLHEATATIQRTLGLTPNAANSTADSNEEAIEGSFYVVAPDALTPPNGAEANQEQDRAHDPSTRFHTRGRQWGFARPKRHPEPTPNRARDEQPDGQFLSGSYSNPAGTRAYKLYIPSSYHGQMLPLIVMLHGCTQSPDDFAAGTCMNSLAEEHQCFVLYPAQAATANPNKCWNWFEASHQRCDHGEPSIIAGLTHHIISTYTVDKRRIYVAGLSAGGAMAAIMGRTYPNLYAAVGVHSGLPYAAAHDLTSAFAAMNQMGAPLGRHRDNGAAATGPFVPTIVFHGNMDKTVHPRNGDEVIAQCATLYSYNGVDTGAAKDPQVTLRRGQVPDGHAYTRAIYRDACGRAVLEQWRIDEAGHAWSGGSPRGSYTDPKGPNASREMIRFFYENVLA
jgi:poly(hydroxyalkanoate) depolymerase family esterase